MSLRLLTLVWESAPYKDGALLLLLALADFSNDEGVSWPAVETLAKKARLGERHARRILRDFETDGVVETNDRGHLHESNVYRINTGKLSEIGRGTISPPTATDGTSATETRTPRSAKGGPDSPPTVRNRQEPPRGETKNELTLEAERFVIWFLALLVETGAREPKLTDSIRASWADCYEKMIRIDGRDKKEVASVCRWARNDSFWRGNFMSPVKLRDKKDGVMYFDLFLNRIENPPSNGTAAHQRPNSRFFAGAGTYPGVTDK